jgi:hypothetical protein
MLLAALASAPAALAHTAFTDFYVDGTPQVSLQIYQKTNSTNHD